MRTAILVLAIIGSVLAFAVGACTGACFSGIGDAAKELGNASAASEANEAGAGFLLVAMLQAILGIMGGIMSFGALGSGKKAKKGGIVILVAAATSITNTMVFFTAGLLHAIAGILALIAKPDGAEPAQQAVAQEVVQEEPQEG